MTNKSRKALLAQEVGLALSSGTLVSGRDVVPCGESAARHILMTRRVLERIMHGGGVAELNTGALAKVRAFLGSFIDGEDIFERVDLKILKPESMCVWELRIRFDPHTRMLGCFIERDLFLATHFYLRSELNGKEADGVTKKWDTAIAKSATELTILLPSATPIRDTRLDLIVSGAILDQ